MPPLVAPPHITADVESAYMDLTSLREASDRSRLRSTTLLLSSSAAFAVAFDSSSFFFSADSDSSFFSSATLVSGGGESQMEDEDDDEAESASPELTPEELGVLFGKEILRFADCSDYQTLPIMNSTCTGIG